MGKDNNKAQEKEVTGRGSLREMNKCAITEEK